MKDDYLLKSPYNIMRIGSSGRAVTVRLNEQLVSRIRKLALKKGWVGCSYKRA